MAPPPPKRTSPQSSPQRPKQDFRDEMSGSIMVNTPGGTVRRSMRSRTFDDPANIISSPSTVVRRHRGAANTSTSISTTSRRRTESPSQEKKKQSNNPLMTPIQPMSKIAQQISNTASLSPPSPTNRRNYTKKATPSTLRSSRSRENPPMYPALSNSFYDYQETQSIYDYDHADVVDDDDYYNHSDTSIGDHLPTFKEEKKKSFFDRLIGSSSVKDKEQQQQKQQFDKQQKTPSYFARIRKVILAMGVILFVIVILTFNFQLLTSSKENINEQEKGATINTEEGKFVELDVAIKMTREMILREREDLKEGERLLKEKIEQIHEKYSALESDYKLKFERFSAEIPSLSDSVEALNRRIDQFSKDDNRPAPSMSPVPDFTSDIQSLKSLSSSLKEDILKLKQKDISNDVPKVQTSPLTSEEEFYIDFASPSLGTRVVVGSTSKSFKPKMASTSTPDYSLSSWIKGLLFGGQYATQQYLTTSSSLSPYLALSPDLTPGNCWSFSGRQGQITLSLGQEIIPTHFTIEHVDPRYLGPNGPIDRTSAPRLLSVWALFKLPSLKDDNGDSEQSSSDDNINDDLSSPPPPPPVKIADFSFSLGEIKKTVSSKIILGEPVRLLQLRIEDNHGKRDYTCLYRWKVHSIHSDESHPFEQDLQ